MTKTEMLLIRACKSSNPRKRIESVYKHQYCNDSNENLYWNLSLILSSLSEKYNIITLSRFISKLNEILNDPHNENTYWESVVCVIIYAIRFTSHDKFDGIILPRRFRC